MRRMGMMGPKLRNIGVSRLKRAQVHQTDSEYLPSRNAGRQGGGPMLGDAQCIQRSLCCGKPQTDRLV